MLRTLFKADETLLHLEVCYFVYCAVNWLCIIDGRVGVPLMVRGRVARGAIPQGLWDVRNALGPNRPLPTVLRGDAVSVLNIFTIHSAMHSPEPFPGDRLNAKVCL